MKLFHTILFLLIGATAFSQDPPVTTQQQLENAAEALEDEAMKDDNFLQLLHYLSRNPVNLNTATTEDLQPLRMLTPLQIQSIIQYRTSLGNFIDIYELQAVPTLDITTIRKIRPYVFVGPAETVKETFGRRFSGGEQYVLARMARVLEKSRGYDTSLSTYYLGTPNRLLLRYRYDYKGLLQYGVVADKDAGEQFFKGAQKQGFDFYSFHFFLRKLGPVKALALGDYVVNLGQGLIHWQSQAFGKSAEVLSVKRQAPVLMPYRSAGEFFFNRGAAITYQLKKFEATAFISSKKFSGNVVSDTVERFTGFLSSGYYRTRGEIADRNRLNNISVGGNINYQTSLYKIGINAIAHQFSLPLQKRDEPYNYFAASGKSMLNASTDYSLTYKNLHLFGEAAMDKNRHGAVVTGALMSVDPKVDLSLVYRNISERYQSLFGNAFTEGTMPTNEKGVYAGLVVRPVTGWQINAYADFYKFPFIKYRVNAPATGVDYLFQIEYHPSRTSEIYIRYRNEKKPVNETLPGIQLAFPVVKPRQNIRMHYVMQPLTAITIKTRVELIWYDKEGKDAGEGYLSYVEAAIKPNSKIGGNVRLQYFETSDYNSRIYAYESDVLYSFSIPAFYDKGFRYYMNFNYDLNQNLSLWFRWAQTIYNGKSRVGSGLDEIAGNKKSEIKLQVKWHF